MRNWRAAFHAGADRNKAPNPWEIVPEHVNKGVRLLSIKRNFRFGLPGVGLGKLMSLKKGSTVARAEINIALGDEGTHPIETVFTINYAIYSAPMVFYGNDACVAMDVTSNLCRKAESQAIRKWFFLISDLSCLMQTHQTEAECIVSLFVKIFKPGYMQHCRQDPLRTSVRSAHPDRLLTYRRSAFQSMKDCAPLPDPYCSNYSPLVS